jgi:hypothetical protein
MTGQKTIRLAAEEGYRVQGTQVVHEVPEGWSDGSPLEERVVTMPTSIQVGATVILVSTTDLARGTTTYWLHKDPSGGVPGNSNPAIKRLHGWRGTTNGRELWAHGRRRVLRVRTLKSGDVAVTVGPDLAPEEP